LKTIGRTALSGTSAYAARNEAYPVDKLRTWIGSDIEITYRATNLSIRTVVGKLVGVAQRDRSGTSPDAVLANKLSAFTLISTVRIVGVRSVMEFDDVWEMNAMDLARIGYEAWKDRSGTAREWLDISHAEKETWLACADAIRNAVNLGA
jgi:hypothetical protein